MARRWFRASKLRTPSHVARPSATRRSKEYLYGSLLIRKQAPAGPAPRAVAFVAAFAVLLAAFGVFLAGLLDFVAPGIAGRA